MINDLDAAKKIYPARVDPIRIVPLFLPEAVGQPTAEVAAAAPAALPKLTYRNGPLLTAVEVFTIFWGPAWQQGTQGAMVAQINQFFDFILTSHSSLSWQNTAYQESQSGPVSEPARS